MAEFSLSERPEPAKLTLAYPPDSSKPALTATGGTSIPKTITVLDEHGNQVATYVGQEGIAPEPRVDTITIEILLNGGGG